MITTDKNHKHKYDKNGKQLCCTQQEKIYANAGTKDLLKEGHSKDDGQDHDWWIRKRFSRFFQPLIGHKRYGLAFQPAGRWPRSGVARPVCVLVCRRWPVDREPLDPDVVDGPGFDALGRLAALGLRIVFRRVSARSGRCHRSEERRVGKEC